MHRSLVVALFVAGCTHAPPFVHGPFTGATTRFYVDALMLPRSRTDFSVDLDGDGFPNNGLGAIYDTLVENGLANQHVDEIVAAGAVDAVVELVSDDPALANDETVGVRWNGARGAVGDEVGGFLAHRALQTNHIQAAQAVMGLPLFDDADPTQLAVDHWELQLTSDGHGGFDGAWRAVMPSAAFVDAAVPGLQRALDVHVDNRTALFFLDPNRDGQITADELETSTLLQDLIAPDATIDGVRELSLAIGVHLSRCADDACTRPLPAPSCFDRVRNGDEVDVDCGGGCAACAPGDACVADGDCRTQHCDGGRCRAPACDDGVRDGFESDVDCGYNCGPCANGRRCDEATDCTSGTCTNSVCG